MTFETIPELLLQDIAQLTKANSIMGNKKSNVTIIYTRSANLKKDGSMAVGAVGFVNDTLVRRVYVKERENAIVNRLMKVSSLKSAEWLISSRWLTGAVVPFDRPKLRRSSIMRQIKRRG